MSNAKHCWCCRLHVTTGESCFTFKSRRDYADSFFIDIGRFRQISCRWTPVERSTDFFDNSLVLSGWNFVRTKRNHLPERYTESGGKEIVEMESESAGTDPPQMTWATDHQFRDFDPDLQSTVLYQRSFFHSRKLPKCAFLTNLFFPSMNYVSKNFIIWTLTACSSYTKLCWSLRTIVFDERFSASTSTIRPK